jgi:hypothetical protein
MILLAWAGVKMSGLWVFECGLLLMLLVAIYPDKIKTPSL